MRRRCSRKKLCPSVITIFPSFCTRCFDSWLLAAPGGAAPPGMSQFPRVQQLNWGHAFKVQSPHPNHPLPGLSLSPCPKHPGPGTRQSGTALCPRAPKLFQPANRQPACPALAISSPRNHNKGSCPRFLLTCSASCPLRLFPRWPLWCGAMCPHLLGAVTKSLFNGTRLLVCQTCHI